MGQDKVRSRSAREREAGIKTAAKGAQKERRERSRASKQRQKQADRIPSGKVGGPTTRRRPASRRGRGPVGRPDGPLARRRRARTRLVLVLLVLLNVAAWLLWPDWAARLAVLILSLVTAPMLIGLAVRRS